MSSSPNSGPEAATSRLEMLVCTVAEAQDAAWATNQMLAAMMLSMVEADLRTLLEHNPWLRAPLPPPEAGQD